MKLDSNRSRSTRPADGERRAVRNLSAQYLVAAKLVYDGIRSGELAWVRLVDPEAGRLDDVVIGRNGRVDAYQIKWSEYRGFVTLKHLTSASKVSGKPYPAPFRLMADGWKGLRACYPGVAVHAHYLMHDMPSSADGSSERMVDGQPGHLQSFLRNAFPSRATWFVSGDAVYANWSTHIESIRDATGLQGEELQEFLTDCEFDLGFDLGPPGWEPLAWADVEDLAHFLMRCISESARGAVELRISDILAGLEWADRYDLRFKHDFPVDEHLYRPIEPTVIALEAAFASFDRGYIALVGPPGSGKSTTLTHMLRYRKGIRLVRYYAFVRDDPQLGRGEAVSFLHDLCVQLESMGFGCTGRRVTHPDTLDGLRNRLTALLRELGDEALRGGGRTIILIDGLDHIDREQDPTRSLIEELPPPASLPRGVLIVLGTQPVGLAGSVAALRPINAQLDEPGRKLTMGPLSRSSIYEIIRAALPPSRLRPGDEEMIAQFSAGHPLSLAYLIKRVANAADDATAQSLLDESPNFGGDTTAEYASYWDDLAKNPEVRDLLALLARIPGAIEISTIKQLASRETVTRFVTTAQHLFRQLTPERWSFFHNSFRQFVLKKSQVDAFGIFDPEVNAEFHRRLAALASLPQTSRELRWQELYHLEQAGQFRPLLDRAQQKLFRDQFIAGRRIPEISEDIERALKAAAEVNDGAAVCRLLLIESELDDRHDALAQTEFTPTLLELSESKDLAGLLFSADELLIPNDLAFRWAARLSGTRSDGLGVKLFEAAEPMNILAGVERAGRIQDQGLNRWAQVAWRFRPLDRVVAAIANVHGEARQGNGQETDDPLEDNTVRLELFTELGIGIQDACDDAAYEKLHELLETCEIGRQAMLRLAFRSARLFANGTPSVGDPVSALFNVINSYPPSQLTEEDAATLADVIARIPAASHRAEDYLARCTSPLTVTELRDAGPEAFEPTEPLFRQARAMAANGRPLNPMDIPSPDKEWDRGLVLFQRMIVLVATVWGEAISGRRTSPEAFVRRLMPVISFRHRRAQEIFGWHHWYVITHSLTVLHQRMLLAAEAHGRPVFEATLSALEAEWSRDVPFGYNRWPASSKRQIIMSAYRVDGNAARTLQHLNEIELSIDSSWDLVERLSELCSIANDWLELGEPARARATLNAALMNSFGVYLDKDYQIETWSHWVARLARSDAAPELVARAATVILRLVPHLANANHGRGISEAISQLIGALANRWPSTALQVSEWLIDEEAANRATVISALLAAELRSGDDTRVAHGLVAAARLLLPFSGYESVFGEALRLLIRDGLLTAPSVAHAMKIFKHIAESTAISGKAYLEVLQGRPGPEDEEDRTSQIDPGGAPLPSMTLANGQILSQDDVNALARRPHEFAGILEEISNNNGLNWTVIIRELFSSGSNASVRRVVRLILGQSPTLPTLEALVEFAALAKDEELAEAAIDQIINSSRPYGWLRHYDGGSRYSASRALRLAYPSNGRARSLKLFISDYIGHGLVNREQIRYLDELLSEFLEELPLAELWQEIEEHVTMLTDWKGSSHQPPLLNLGRGSDSSETSVRLLMRDITQLPGSLAWEARRGLLDTIDIGDPLGTVCVSLKEAIKGDYRLRHAGLAILECLAFRRPDVAANYVDDLKELAWDRSSVTRFAVQNILEQLGAEVPLPPKQTTLPAFYQIQFPPAPSPEVSLSGDHSAPGEPLPDTDDPLDLTRMFHGVLERLASETKIEFDTLARRMALLMRTVAPPDTWSAEVERRLSGKNESLGLKLTYRRPRSLVAQHAFGKLISELCDAGAIEWVPRYTREMLLVADPPGNLIEPVPKPAWLEIPNGEELGKYPTNDWMGSVSDALPKVTHTPDGYVVLAELTSIARYDSDRVEEHRLSVIGHRELPFRDDQTPDIHELWHKERYLARDYPMLYQFNASLPITVIAGGSLLSDVRFLALNPYLGLNLGWSFATEGLFRWTDSTGEIMAETVKWSLGNIDAHDTGGYRERAGEGWLVLASEKAWDSMRPVLRYFVRHRLAGRLSGYKRSGERDMKTARDSLPI